MSSKHTRQSPDAVFTQQNIGLLLTCGLGEHKRMRQHGFYPTLSTC